MNHTERIAYVARQDRRLTRNLVRDAVELYLETLAEDIASGEWVDLPGIGKVQVTARTRPAERCMRSKAMATANCANRSTRLRTKVRLNAAFKSRCRATLIR